MVAYVLYNVVANKADSTMGASKVINRIQLLRNVGQFDSVNGAASIALSRLTLIYAENGRGKTTLAAILRSLGSNDPVHIAERRRLGATQTPHVVLDCIGGPPAAMFQNNAWNRTVPNVAVFDDQFVDQNVYSGLAVGAEHRQNLHELILGAQGIALNHDLQTRVAQIEAHNIQLRAKGNAIPAGERGSLSIDDFCALPVRADIDTAIQACERNLAAVREQDPIRNQPAFDTLSLPAFDIAGINSVLERDLPALDALAVARVQAHLASLGHGGEAWVSEGMLRVREAAAAGPSPICPFCAQDIAESPVLAHYRAYFSTAYSDLQRTIADAIAANARVHGGDVPAAFERLVRVAGERRTFWARFGEFPEVTVDTAAIARDWRAARDAVGTALANKQSSPLERATLSPAALEAIATFDAHRAAVALLNAQLQSANGIIRIVKEQAATGNPNALTADLARLRAVKARHTPTTSSLCQAYLDEKAAKAVTEELRDNARQELERHRTTVFPAYQTAINVYLQRFNAGFRLDSVVSANTRSGSSCTYNVLINNTAVPVAGGVPTPGEPSFRNTLSAGDRNTLALAFFFASLDQDPSLANNVVVVDDPMSSLDEHRSLTTVQEIRRFASRVAQVIVLSHSKPFLCRLWEGADTSFRAALQVTREGAGSTLRAWDVNQDCITEHDKRHALLREYLVSSVPNNREVARAIRPVLEAFCRVAFPEHFPPGTLLGPFRNLCDQRVNTAQPILDADDLRELRDLTEYANKFHHDTNQAWESEAINDLELVGFVRRAIALTTR
jgi:wobble nucleotide-excising tRNase